jgi:hypothetical protein
MLPLADHAEHIQFITAVAPSQIPLEKAAAAYQPQRPPGDFKNRKLMRL